MQVEEINNDGNNEENDDEESLEREKISFQEYMEYEGMREKISDDIESQLVNQTTDDLESPPLEDRKDPVIASKQSRDGKPYSRDARQKGLFSLYGIAERCLTAWRCRTAAFPGCRPRRPNNNARRDKPQPQLAG